LEDGVIGRAILLAATLMIAGCSHVEPQAKEAMRQPVRQVDHIMIRVQDPRELYAFFTEVLELPVAWPLTSPRPGATTGGVSFGNVNVEVIQVPGQQDQGPRLMGLAFEPSPLNEALAELGRRGIVYGEPRPLVSTAADGSKSTLWTNVTLLQFSDSDSPADAGVHVFLSEYSSTYVDVEERRARLHKQLTDSGGGPLGVVAVKEVVIGAADFEASRRLWRRLLDSESSPGIWQVGDGPAIHLVPAAENAIQAFVIEVASLSRSRMFLRERSLLGSESVKEATIDPSRIGGLNIRFVEAQR
jgi:catechol 2,3-dioxygenase-like lactoylglutathione lyase family enzyme